MAPFLFGKLNFTLKTRAGYYIGNVIIMMMTMAIITWQIPFKRFLYVCQPGVGRRAFVLLIEAEFPSIKGCGTGGAGIVGNTMGISASVIPSFTNTCILDKTGAARH